MPVWIRFLAGAVGTSLGVLAWFVVPGNAGVALIAVATIGFAAWYAHDIGAW